MNKNRSIYVGVDVGSAQTKVALLNSNKELVGFAVKKTGIDFGRTANECIDNALTMSNNLPNNIVRTVSTGYGRNNLTNVNDTKTEIGCHAKGAYHYFPHAMTIIDIGGQDNKVIKIDDNGRRIDFKMNRKCAAGTGAFLEDMSNRLDIPLEDMDKLARQSTEMITLGSYCTVFTATEVLEKIRQGKKVPDIVNGLFYSVIKRVFEMDRVTGRLAMTGGVVQHNPFIVEMVREIIGADVLLPEHPQLTGAIGAALYAAEG